MSPPRVVLCLVSIPDTVAFPGFYGGGTFGLGPGTEPLLPDNAVWVIGKRPNIEITFISWIKTLRSDFIPRFIPHLNAHRHNSSTKRVSVSVYGPSCHLEPL